MGKYLLQASYTQTGLAGLVKEGGTSRRAALTETIEGVGGSLESLYFAFGKNDLFITADLPMTPPRPPSRSPSAPPGLLA